MKKILIIDDEKTVSSALSFGLKKIGHKIVVIQNPVEVIPQLKNSKFDLLILDYNLTLFSGADVIKLIDNHNIQIPIVIISSQNANEIANRELRIDRESNFISKDQPISTILSQIENTLLIQNHNHYLGGSYAES
ncbi:MAG: response regulator [Melioribacteraceae bacterium]|nr:response regulator [Melioribacteraceae bacterium]